MHSLNRGQAVNVFTADHTGKVVCTTLRSHAGWTVTLYGIVKFEDSHRDANWIRWSDVFHVAGHGVHCIDWTRIPTSLISSGTRADVCDEYKRRSASAAWFGTVSVGPKPDFGTRSTAIVNSKLPPKWRVIQGGRA